MKNAYKLEIFEIFLIKTFPVYKSVLSILAVSGISTLFLPSANLLGFLQVFGTGIITAELIYVFIEGYFRRWSYFLSFISMLLASISLIASYFLPVSFQTGLWIAAGVFMLNTLQVLIITSGLSNILRILFPAFIGPSLIVISLGNFSNVYAAVFTSSALFVVLSAVISEKIVSIKIDVSGFEFSSALTQRKKLEVEAGEEVKRPIQRMEIVNPNEKLDLLIPGLHPGLIAKIGGGNLSKQIIDSKMEDGEGFHLKPPVSHRLDLANPDSVQEVLESQPDIENKFEKVSKLYSVESKEFTVYGRRLGENEMLLMFQSEVYDDVEASIYSDILNSETDIFIDIHGQEGDRLLRADTKEASNLKRKLTKVLDELEEFELGNYEAGFSRIDDGVRGYSVVEKVGDQRSLMIFFEGNDVPEEMRNELRDQLGDQFDHLLIFTNDSHRNPFKMEVYPDLDKIISSVESSEELYDSAVGTGSNLSPELRVLNEDYISIMNCFNIAARFFITCLGLSYLILILGILMT